MKRLAPSERLEQLRRRYAKLHAHRRDTEPVVHEMRDLVTKQLKREIREDRRKMQ